MYNNKIGGNCDETNVGRYNIAGRQHTDGRIFLMIPVQKSSPSIFQKIFWNYFEPRKLCRWNGHLWATTLRVWSSSGRKTGPAWAGMEPVWILFSYQRLEIKSLSGILFSTQNSEQRLNPKSLITDDGESRRSIGSEIVRKNLTKNRPQSFLELLKLQIWSDENRPNREKFQRSLNLIQKWF